MIAASAGFAFWLLRPAVAPFALPIIPRAANDAEQRAILLAALTFREREIQPHAAQPETARPAAPVLILDGSFSLGAGSEGNVYPHPSCRDSRVGEDIVAGADKPITYINDAGLMWYPAALAKGLVDVNRTSARMPDPGIAGVTMIGHREVSAIFEATPRDWDQFRNAFPGSEGYLQATRAVVAHVRSNDGQVWDEALIYVFKGVPPACGSTTLYHLIRFGRDDWGVDSAYLTQTKEHSAR